MTFVYPSWHWALLQKCCWHMLTSDATVAHSVATVAAIKTVVNCFERHKTPMKWLVSLSEFDQFSPITSGKSRRVTQFNYCIPFKLTQLTGSANMHSCGQCVNTKPDTRFKTGILWNTKRYRLLQNCVNLFDKGLNVTMVHYMKKFHLCRMCTFYSPSSWTLIRQNCFLTSYRNI